MVTNTFTESITVTRLKAREVLDFTEQLESFIGTDISLDQSLEKLREIYEEGNPERPITEIVGELRLQVIAGKKFSEALSKFPHTFSRFYLSMIEAGETTGNLAEILRHLTSYLKREDDLKARVKGALTYPVILVVLGIGVTMFLLVSVVPRFEQMFRESGQVLPVYTQIMLSVSSFLASYKGALMLLGVVAIFYGLLRYIRTETGRAWFDVWILKVPLIGPLVRKVAAARFTLLLGILLQNNVELLTALNIGKAVTGNKVLENTLTEASLRVNAGENMCPSLRGVFPLKAVQMLEVGEANARLADMSLSVANRYEKEVQDQLKVLTSVLEPMLLVILGGLICFIALAIFLPMISQPQF